MRRGVRGPIDSLGRLEEHGADWTRPLLVRLLPIGGLVAISDAFVTNDPMRLSANVLPEPTELARSIPTDQSIISRCVAAAPCAARAWRRVGPTLQGSIFGFPLRNGEG